MGYDVNKILLKLHDAQPAGLDPRKLFSEVLGRNEQSEREIWDFILGEGLVSLPDKEHVVLTSLGIAYCRSMGKI